MEGPLLSQEFIQKLEKLSLLSRKLHRKGQQGNHFSYRKGSSLEFQEYRPYQNGDDLKFIDWNVWERLGKILVKVFNADEDRTIYLMVDSSGSMGSGTPTKLTFACQAAAALSYIAGKDQDRVSILSMGERIKDQRRPIKGTGALFDSLSFLESLSPQGPTGFNSACRHFTQNINRSGIVVIFSDLFDPQGYEEGIKRLLHRHFEVVLIQILAEEDMNPPFSGPVNIKGKENDATLKITVDGELRKAYNENLVNHLNMVQSFCRINQVEYLLGINTMPFEELILTHLRKGIYLK